MSKGSAWPADFSQDIPEYSDEELAREMKLADEEVRKRRGLPPTHLEGPMEAAEDDPNRP